MDDRRNFGCCKSPLGITLLMHAHFDPQPDGLGNGSPADVEAIENLIDHGLIEKIPEGIRGRFRTTAKGQFHVKALCNLPFPEAVSVWVTPKE